MQSGLSPFVVAFELNEHHKAIIADASAFQSRL
jgi:hypothetical protein